MNNNTYLSDEDYDFIYSRVPRICIDLLVKNSKGEVLLTQRTIEPYLNHWHFPGGRIKFKESIQDAVNRIAKGELGIELSNTGTVVGTCEFPNEIQKEQERHSISIVHEILLPNDVSLSAQDKYKWCSEVPVPTIPPQAEFLKKNNIL